MTARWSAFMARKLEIDAMLQQLTELSANHFGVDPRTSIGAMSGRWATTPSCLRQVSDSAFQEGEHAA